MNKYLCKNEADNVGSFQKAIFVRFEFRMSKYVVKQTSCNRKRSVWAPVK